VDFQSCIHSALCTSALWSLVTAVIRCASCLIRCVPRLWRWACERICLWYFIRQSARFKVEAFWQRRNHYIHFTMGQSTDDTESKESTRKGFRFWGGKRKERKDGKLSSSVAKVAPPASKVTDSIASHTPSPRSIPISSAVTAPSKGILKKELAEDAAAKPVSTLGKSEQEAHGKHKLPRTWLYRSKRFRKWCEWAFNVIDTDNSNKVTETELYSGLLLIHLKLGTYAGPAACRPLSRERCHAMFQKMDLDGSGFLEFDEFQQAMSVLFGNILLRVIAQWSLTIMVSFVSDNLDVPVSRITFYLRVQADC
jgi:hypothetical protein